MYAAVEDSTLEMMTASLLQISSVFLVQQNELQEVRHRLQRELARVSLIQERLSSAAQQHQDAVLSVIQNYENLATESQTEKQADMPLSPVSLKPDVVAPKLVRQLHVPPVAMEVSTFYAKEREGEGEEEGIKYVDKLHVVGGILGRPLEARGEFVGTPSVQWHRQQAGGRLDFSPIEGATELSYTPSADDVGACLRVECVGPYGGESALVETSPVALDSQTHAELMSLFGRGHAEFNAMTAQGEPRILLVTRKNIKVRSRLSRLVTTATTLYKQAYEQPLTVSVVHANPNELELRLGAHRFELTMESTRLRDLAIICIRMFAGPNCPTHADSRREEETVEPEEQERPETVEPLDSKWSDEEGEGEEFKPAIKISMRSKEEAVVADSATLKSFSLSLAPPKASSRSRGKGKVKEESQLPKSDGHEPPGFDDSFGMQMAEPTPTETDFPEVPSAERDPLEVESADHFHSEVGNRANDPFGFERAASDAFEVGRAANDPFEVDRPASDPFRVDMPASDPFEVDRPASDPFRVDRPASDPFRVDRPASDPFEVDRVASDPFQVDRVASDPFQIDRVANDPFQVDRVASDPFEVDRAASDPFEVEKAAGQPFEAERAASQHLEIGSAASQPFRVERFENDLSECADVERPPSELVRAHSHPPEIGRTRSHEAENNLFISEVVNAHLRGKQLLQYQVVGELRASVKTGGDFKFRLKNAHRIEQLKANDKFVTCTAGGEYLVSLPQVNEAQSYPLISELQRQTLCSVQ
ncbi:MAG: hypothetical protein SGPRY_005648 [Prymnesium sp.]